MKTFKKLALVSAIAAAPFAAQAMEAMDDSALGNATGQAGVTIEMSIGDEGISIGGITYTDTAAANGLNAPGSDGKADRYVDADGNVVAFDADDFAADDQVAKFDGGSVVMQNLTVKNITKLVQTIDVSSEGHLLMGMSGDSALVQKVLVDGVLTDKTIDPVDGSATTGWTTTVASANNATSDEIAAETAARNAAISAGVGVKNIQIALGGNAATSAVLLQGANGNQAELVNNLSLSVDLGDSVTTVYNMSNTAESSDYQATGAGVFVTSDMLLTGKARVSNGTGGTRAATQDDVTAANVLLASQIGGAANTLGAVGVIGDNAINKPAMAIGMEASFRLNNLDVGVFGYTQAQAKVDSRVVAAKPTGLDATDVVYDSTTGVASKTGVAAVGSQATAINVYNATLNSVATGSAVGIKGMSFAGLDGGLVKIDQVIWADAKGVNMQIGQIQGNLNINAIEIGGSSIGSVAVTGINLAGMTQTIYGH